MFRSSPTFDKLLGKIFLSIRNEQNVRLSNLLIIITFVVEKATSHLQLETDWVSILQICDLIRQGDVQ